MALSKIISRLRLAALATLAVLPVVSGAQTNETESLAVTNLPAFAVNVRRDVADTYMPYRYAFVTLGQEKYTFLIPEGYRVDTSDPAKVKLVSPDYSSLIVLAIGTSGLPVGAKMEAESLQAHVLNRHPAATVKENTGVGANGQNAAALDYVWKTEAGVTRTSRTAFVPTANGLMEFTLSASPEKFDAALGQLNLILLTFRTGANGKFEYVIGSKYP